MEVKLSNQRRALLAHLEGIIGNEFYNTSTRNYGPGGLRLGDGRSLRYPVTFRLPDGELIKLKTTGLVSPKLPIESFLTGHYVVGTNHLDIISALNDVVGYLEQRYGFSVDSSEASSQTQSDT